jgi:outer membrane protein assembly factor BamD (BamD/ComL family)
MHRIINSLKSVLACAALITPINSLEAKRHSLVRREERVEQRKKVIKTDDETLATILRKQTKDMSFSEAYRAQEYYRGTKDLEMQTKCGQRLLAVAGSKEAHKDQEEIMRKTRLELAQIFLEKHNYNDAEKYAQEYQKLYPGTKEALTAEYIIIRANYLAKLDADRDQKKTRTALTLAQEFLEKHPQEKELTVLIKEMIHDCYQSLIRHEMHVITTQLHTHRNTGHVGTLQAIQKRLAHINKELLPHAPIAKKRLLELELEVAQRSQAADKVAATTKTLDELKGPDKPVVIAQASRKKRRIRAITEKFFISNDRFFA